MTAAKFTSKKSRGRIIARDRELTAFSDTTRPFRSCKGNLFQKTIRVGNPSESHSADGAKSEETISEREELEIKPFKKNIK